MTAHRFFAFAAGVSVALVLLAACGTVDEETARDEQRLTEDLPGELTEFNYVTQNGRRLVCIYIDGGYDGGLSCVEERP